MNSRGERLHILPEPFHHESFLLRDYPNAPINRRRNFIPCAGIAGAAEVADGREGGGMTRQEAIGEKRRLLENGGGRGRRCANLSGERSSGLVEEPERPECVDGARFRHCFSRSSAV